MLRLAATSTPTNDEYIIALYGWVVARMSVSVEPSPRAIKLAPNAMIMTIMGMNALKARNGIFSFGTNSSPSSAGNDSCKTGLTWPRRARSSAVYIGPKSLPVEAIINTKIIARIG